MVIYNTLTRSQLMKIYMIGINHNDPLGRDNLRNWLQILSNQNSDRPAFVAIEYDQQHFERIKAQRSDFLIKLQSTFLTIPLNDLIRLTQSLAYEGDTHIDVLPNVKTIWLDEDRQAYETDIKNYAERRLGIYKSFLKHCKELTLIELSKISWQVANPDSNPNRCEMFARRVIKEALNKIGHWAIIIVGANHVSSAPTSMRSILEVAGFNCEVIVLNRILNSTH